MILFFFTSKILEQVKLLNNYQYLKILKLSNNNYALWDLKFSYDGWPEKLNLTPSFKEC